MTTFQSDLIKMVNDGKNVLLIGSPGIGKTIAYAIAVLCHVDTEKNYPHVLCLCSSHEAAIQTGQILTQMATYTDIKIGYATRDTNGTENFAISLYFSFLLFEFVLIYFKLYCFQSIWLAN